MSVGGTVSFVNRSRNQAPALVSEKKALSLDWRAIGARACARVCACARVHAHMCMRACACARARVHAHTRACMHTRACACTHARVHEIGRAYV